jgi:molybdenum cofactor synthesis domain-containing protein
MRQGIFEADIIATGSELTFGQLIDTNSAWIADQLTRCGGLVRQIIIVGDRVSDIASVLRMSLGDKRKLIVSTGGLGPTEDDLTIEAIASAIGGKVITNEKAVAMVRAKCDEFKLEMTDRRRRMARTVEGASLLRNCVGLAPGTRVSVGDTVIVALPGIPKEMKPMFQSEVLPEVQKWSKGRVSVLNVRVFCGSERFALFRQMQAEFPTLYLKFYAEPPSSDPYSHTKGVCVVLLTSGEDEERASTELNSVVNRFKKLLEEKGGRLEIYDKT